MKAGRLISNTDEVSANARPPLWAVRANMQVSVKAAATADRVRAATNTGSPDRSVTHALVSR